MALFKADRMLLPKQVDIFQKTAANEFPAPISL